MKLFVQNSADNVCRFAREEFEKYAWKMFQDLESLEDGCGIFIGLPSDAGCDSICYSETADTIFIDVKDGKGIISGSNPRSVLIAVYRFLRECGCRFLRPGPKGEYIPRRLLSNIKVNIQETASSEVRGIIIEGACSYENVLNVIDYSPKVGLNRYRFQFRESFVFFERWYDHISNPKMEPAHITVETVVEMVEQLKAETKKRGLLLHTMGHGWTTDPIGLHSTGWHQVEMQLPEETIALLAKTNGARQLNHNTPLKTHLCYSNKVVQDKIIDYMVEYCKANMNSDYIHFGLADSFNASCECENCNPYRLTDLMVRLLNRADERLTKEGLHHRIIFGAYSDRLWAPVLERINNPDRFCLQCSPITRPYHMSYPLDNIPVEEPAPYITNQLRLPRTLRDNLAYFRAWQKVYPGRCHMGEYHYMWAHYADIGYQKIARILHEDICKLKDMKMDGILSFQVQRCAVPTAMGFYTYGHALWNPAITFEELSKDYFSHAYGENWQNVLDYLNNLSETFDMKIKREGRNYEIQDCLADFEKCLEMVQDFRKAYDDYTVTDNEVQQLSWKYLTMYNQYLVRFLAGMIVAAKGQIAEGRQMIKDTIDWLFELEEDEDIQAGWDIMTMDKKLLTYFDDLVTGSGDGVLTF